ncbi:MAG: carboxylating nicotinate-nucleotide diphosphorylase [Candidatus Omnitrophota bacterium]
MSYVDDIDVIKEALKEDIGKRDITTIALVPKNISVRAVLLAKEDFVVCGLHIAKKVFMLIDKNIRFNSLVKEGEYVKKGEILAKISGKARGILTAERVALNFLSMLSGVSTLTRRYVQKVRPYKARILDTRKTIPGLRLFLKYAVRIGGGFNHRFCLDEMVLLKDNHLKAIGDSFWEIGFKKNKKYRREIEVNTLKEFRNALELNPDIIMLDNMSLKQMNKAVKLRNNPRPKLEASGGITLKNVKKVASTGVDFISVGELTHSVDSVDISLEIL